MTLPGPQATPSADEAAGRVPADLAPLIREAAGANGIDPALLTAMVWAETALGPWATWLTTSGGPIRLTPAMARELGVTDPLDPAQSLGGAARHLRCQIETFRGDLPLAVAAFIAGPSAVLRHDGVPPYSWSQTYVSSVMGCYEALTAPVAAGTAGRPVPPPRATAGMRTTAIRPAQALSGGARGDGTQGIGGVPADALRRRSSAWSVCALSGPKRERARTE